MKSLCLLALLCVVGLMASARAQANDATIPVIIMGEDSDPKSVRRNHDIFKRVVSGLKDQLGREFRIVDEDFLAGELGWKTTERRSRAELALVLKALRDVKDPRIQSRAVVVFSINATATDRGFATVATVRVAGELLSATGSGDSLGNWESPLSNFPGPANCNQLCIEELVGGKARDVAASVGNVLRRKLAHLANEPGPDGLLGLKTEYLINFKNFHTRDVLKITDVMEREFPGFAGATPPSGDSVSYTYGYSSRAPVAKLDRWLKTLLMDLGFDPDNEVKITTSGTEFIIDKLFDTKPPPKQGGGRFN